MAAARVAAVIEIRIIDEAAVRKLNNVANAQQRINKRTRTSIVRFKKFRSAVATLTKALISMIGVLIAFNLLITLPQRIFQGIVQVLRLAATAISDFEQRIIGLQAIISTTTLFSDDPLENFVIAGRVANAVVESLAFRAAEMVVSLDEALIVFQTLAATGGTEVVNNFQEMVDLTVLLSNAIAGVTVGQDRQRQLAEETRSLMTGQFRATSLLVRLLFRSKKEFDAFKLSTELAGNFVEQMTERLKGFSLAAMSLGQTMEGIKTTAQTILQMFARRALGGVFHDAQMQAAGFLERVQEDIGRFNVLAASVASTFKFITRSLLDAFGININKAINDTSGFLDDLIKLVPKVAGVFAFVIQLVTNTISFLKIFSPIANAVFKFILNGLIAIGEIWALQANFLERVGKVGIFQAGKEAFDIFQKNLNSSITGYDELFDIIAAIPANISEWANAQTASQAKQEAITQATANTANELERIRKEQGDINELARESNNRGRLNISQLNEEIKLLLKKTTTTRALARNMASLLQAQASGLLSLKLGGTVGGGFGGEGGAFDELSKRARAIIEKIGETREKISKAESGDLIFDQDQFDTLVVNLDLMRSQLAGVASDTVSLKKTLIDTFDVTFTDIAQKLKNVAILPLIESLYDSINNKSVKFSISMKDVFDDLKTFLTSKEGLTQILMALGTAFSQLFTGIFNGTKGAGEAIKEFGASLLQTIGQVAIAYGTIALLMGIFTGNAAQAATGAKLMAAGIVALALAAALGGGGGATSPTTSGAGGESIQRFTFDQSLINVQQDFLGATDRLTQTMDRFESMSPGDVLVKGSKEKSITKLVADDSRRSSSFTATQRLGNTLRGE